jgi:hypothetical protein
MLIKKHIKKHLAARACAGQNTRLGKKTPNNAGVDFYITAQAVELHQENPHQYDELASGRLVGGLNTYAYVAGNPISNTDPEGLQVPGTWETIFRDFRLPSKPGQPQMVCFLRCKAAALPFTASLSVASGFAVSAVCAAGGAAAGSFAGPPGATAGATAGVAVGQQLGRAAGFTAGQFLSNQTCEMVCSN